MDLDDSLGDMTEMKRCDQGGEKVREDELELGTIAGMKFGTKTHPVIEDSELDVSASRTWDAMF